MVFVVSIFTTTDRVESEVCQIAEHIVEANLASHDSQRIGLTPAYLVHRNRIVSDPATTQRVRSSGRSAVSC